MAAWGINMDIVTEFPKHLCDFVQHLSTLQLIIGGVVALFFGLAASSIGWLIIVPVFAALVYIVADAVIPPLMHHTPLVMPVFDKALLHEAITLYVAFLAIIIVLFVIKKAILAVIR
jgi:membrane-anchored protein YejM (alkaline phosphatase superfamily)